MARHNVYLITKGGERIDLVLDVGKRKSMTLAISEGKLTARVPEGCDMGRVREYIEKNLDWIHKNLDRSARRSCTPIRFEPGEEIMLLGETVTLTLVKAERYFPARVVGDQLQIADGGHSDRNYISRQVMELVYGIARREITESMERLTKRMGLYPKRVTIKSMTASWGRCSSDGNISINYKVVAYPKTHIDYVCIHELSHLRHMDHSPEFWALVATQCPDWKRIRNSMKP